jgi:hypothetical protein
MGEACSMHGNEDKCICLVGFTKDRDYVEDWVEMGHCELDLCGSGYIGASSSICCEYGMDLWVQ